ncbi:hypothetical protein [Fibrella aestuarina]|nr:hypothetical protein [Fibrella aestuarina]
MKTIRALSLVLLIALAGSSCTPNMKFNTSTIVPSATGEIKVRKDRNQNYAIDIRIFNLAEPEKLSPAKSAYVVWMESDGNSSPKKLGRINTGTGLFSKALKAELHTTVTTKPTRIFVSAEDSPDVDYPQGAVVLST